MLIRKNFGLINNTINFELMFINKQLKKATAITIFTMASSMVFASFTLTGTVGEKAKSSKYSLKNISHFSNKSFSLSLLRTTLQNKGIVILTPKKSNLNSFIQLESGNTTYMMPYKFKVKNPKFKTPSPNN